MAVSLKHSKTSVIPDGVDTTRVQPSDWNSEHTLTMSAGYVLGRRAGTAGAAQELPLMFDSGDNAALPAGLVVGGAYQVLGLTYNSVSTPLTATGASQSTALILTANYSEVTTTAAGTGVRLQVALSGADKTIWNRGSNTLRVYPPVGGTINGLATNAADMIPPGQTKTYTALTTTRFRTRVDKSGATGGVIASPFDYGAIGDGTTDDTAAVQAAYNAIPSTGGAVLLPSGYAFMISVTLNVKTKTATFGGGKIVAAAQASWPAGVFHCFKNVNFNASTITDTDIIFRDIELDWSAVNSGGSAHLFHIRMARRVIVEDCKTQGGASVTAFLACDDTLVQGNRFKGFLNCGIDHWDNPRNARAIGNYLEADNSAQMVNFNPDPTTGSTSPGYIASGFTMTGNTLVGLKASGTASQVEPLRSGAYMTGATITGNYLSNCYFAVRGDVRASVVANNTIVDLGGTAEAITNYVFNGGTASGLVIANNVIRNPSTATPNLGVIRAESASASILGNTILGTGYTTTAIYRGASSVGYASGNYAQTNPSAGQLQSGFRLDNGGNTGVFGWRDASGSAIDMYCQSDNHWLFRGTNSSGAARSIMSIYMRSSTSSLGFSVPVQFNSTISRDVSQVAAAGTAIGTATDLPSNLNEVTSATAGSAVGVRLLVVTGLEQTVVNSTAVTINVYPNNSGSSTIDGGAANAPVTVAAGKSKTFALFSSNNYRTVAAT